MKSCAELESCGWSQDSRRRRRRGARGAPTHSGHLWRVSGGPLMFCHRLPSQPGLVAQAWAAPCSANGKPFLSADSHMLGSICLLPSDGEEQNITDILYIPRYLMLQNTDTVQSRRLENDSPLRSVSTNDNEQRCGLSDKSSLLPLTCGPTDLKPSFSTYKCSY